MIQRLERWIQIWRLKWRFWASSTPIIRLTLPKAPHTLESTTSEQHMDLDFCCIPRGTKHTGIDLFFCFANTARFQLAYDVWDNYTCRPGLADDDFPCFTTTPPCPLFSFSFRSFHFWRGLYYRATAVKSMIRQELCISSFTALNLIRLPHLLPSKRALGDLKE